MQKLVLLIVCSAVIGNSSVIAQEKEITDLISQFTNAQKAAEAADALVKIGVKAVPSLLKESLEGKEMDSRSWSIACLGEIRDKSAIPTLTQIAIKGDEKELIRIFALKALLAFSDQESFEGILTVFGQGLIQGDLYNEVVKQINESLNVDTMIKIWLKGKNDTARSQAAGFLAGKDSAANRVKVMDMLGYTDDNSKAGVPWKGGALWIPRINWTKEERFALVSSLIHWWYFSDKKTDRKVINQIRNNIGALGGNVLGNIWNETASGFINSVIRLNWDMSKKYLIKGISLDNQIYEWKIAQLEEAVSQNARELQIKQHAINELASKLYRYEFPLDAIKSNFGIPMLCALTLPFLIGIFFLLRIRSLIKSHV